MHIECRTGRSFIGRVERGADLLDELHKFCRKHEISLGQLQVIGAVEQVRIGWYDQQKQRYTEPRIFDGGLEILSCLGTISLLEGQPHIHAHIHLSRADFSTFGGHLYSGTVVYNAEFIICEQIGPPLHREYDTNLKAPVWFASSIREEK